MQLQVLMPIPTTFRHCPACEALAGDTVGNIARAEMVGEYPAEFLAEFDRLVRWINELTLRFGPALQVRVADPWSLEGLWKCLRYGVYRYPTFLMPGGRKVVGWNWDALEESLRGITGRPEGSSTTYETGELGGKREVWVQRPSAAASNPPLSQGEG